MARVTVVGILLTVLTVSELYETKMLRNQALLSKMISNFQRPKKTSLEPVTTVPETPTTAQEPDSVVSLMQGLLCRNFPDVPCDVIQHDQKLRNLISMSVKEIQEIPETSSVPSDDPPPPQQGGSSYSVSRPHSHKSRKNKRKVYSGGHKMSKFFPHKVKSVRPQPEWQIDYTRHGEPALSASRTGLIRGKFMQHLHTMPKQHLEMDTR